MPLAAGTKLGRYEIRSLIGAGGMGEVYQATDAQLRRDVAIKVLPAEFTNDADRLRRFQQEALATAALNHPHIVAVHDAGAHEGTAYVVTELLEGRTLKDVMAAGALPLRKAVDYATQIASGLAAAHEKGIVHRDLKPANLFITKDERVKILDFGLARVMAASPSDQSATATVPGAVLGTVGYMAPEQVRGEVADHRADIFAFGVILYEMLSRRRAFQRESVPGTLAAILHDDPPTWAGDGTSLSLRLLRLTQRCLEKSPAARFQSARDLMLVLSDEVSDPTVAAAPVSARRRAPMIAAAVAGALVFTLLGVWIGGGLRTARQTALDTVSHTTYKLLLPDGVRISGVPAISRDGRTIVYALVRNEVRSLYVFRLASGAWQELPETAGANAPFFSPDGSQVGFVQTVGQRSTLMRTALDGPRPFLICECDAGAIRGASWGDDDRIVLGARTGGLRRVAASGGPVETITTLDQTEISHRYPQVLPGASRVVFTVGPKRFATRAHIAASVIGSGKHVALIEDGQTPQYVPGYLVYVKRVGEVHAVAFDSDALEVSGPSFALAERPAGGASTLDATFRVSETGSALYVPFSRSLRQLTVWDRAGNRTPLPLAHALERYGVVRVTKDGQRLLVEVGSGLSDVDIEVLHLANRATTRLTEDGNSRYPIWGPDDASVIYSVRGGAEETIYLRGIDVNGRPTGDARPLVSGTPNGGPFSVAGRALLFGQDRTPPYWDLLRVDIDKSELPEVLVDRLRSQYAASVSPDGKWMVFASDEQGPDKWEIYLTTYPRGAVTKIADGLSPSWSRSGNEVFFVQDTRLFALRLNAGAPAGPAVPTGIHGVVSSGPGLMGYAELPDGRFVVITPESDSPVTPTPTVILNWASQFRSSK